MLIVVIAFRNVTNLPVGDREIAEYGVRSQRIVLHALNRGLRKAAVRWRETDVAVFVVPLCEKRQIDMVKRIFRDDRINDAASHKYTEFFGLNIIAVPAGYHINRIPADDRVLPVLHHDRALHGVAERAVKHPDIRVVFVDGIAVGVDAAVQILKFAVCDRHIFIRRPVKFGILTVEAVRCLVRRIDVDGAPLAVFVVGKAAARYGYVFGGVDLDKMAVAQIEKGNVFHGNVLAVRNPDRRAFIAFIKIYCDISLAFDPNVLFPVVAAHDPFFVDSRTAHALDQDAAGLELLRVRVADFVEDDAVLEHDRHVRRYENGVGDIVSTLF